MKPETDTPPTEAPASILTPPEVTPARKRGRPAGSTFKDRLPDPAEQAAKFAAADPEGPADDDTDDVDDDADRPPFDPVVNSEVTRVTTKSGKKLVSVTVGQLPPPPLPIALGSAPTKGKLAKQYYESVEREGTPWAKLDCNTQALWLSRAVNAGVKL